MDSILQWATIGAALSLIILLTGYWLGYSDRRSEDARIARYLKADVERLRRRIAMAQLGISD